MDAPQSLPPATASRLSHLFASQGHKPLLPFNTAVLTAGDLDGNGQDDLFGAFPGAGVWLRVNNRVNWFQLHPSDAEQLLPADIDGNRQMDAVIDFGSGVWAWRLNTDEFMLLLPLNPEGMTAGDLDGQ